MRDGYSSLLIQSLLQFTWLTNTSDKKYLSSSTDMYPKKIISQFLSSIKIILLKTNLNMMRFKIKLYSVNTPPNDQAVSLNIFSHITESRKIKSIFIC